MLRSALNQVRASLPQRGVATVEIPTDPGLRDLYRKVADECSARDLEVDTLLVHAIAAAERGRST